MRRDVGFTRLFVPYTTTAVVLYTLPLYTDPADQTSATHIQIFEGLAHSNRKGAWQLYNVPDTGEHTSETRSWQPGAGGRGRKRAGGRGRERLSAACLARAAACSSPATRIEAAPRHLPLPETQVTLAAAAAPVSPLAAAV